MSKRYLYIGLAILVAVVVAYGVWYSSVRHEKLVEAAKCNDTLAHPPQPTMVTGPDGKPAPLYSLNGCITVVVPPSLWDVVRGHMVFENVPNRMKVNPYSVADILLGRYTFGPTDVRCDQSATTTDCSQLVGTSTVQVDGAELARIALVRLQQDVQNGTPHFIDTTRANGQSLTPQEQKIKDDVVAFFVAGQPESTDYYSLLWLNSVGKRYILVSQPSAESSFDEIIDTQTGTVKPISGEARYYLALEGRDVVLYIDTQAVRTYVLDQADAVLVPGSQLSGNETYHSGTSDAYLTPQQTHTKDSITIAVFDSSQIVQNPETLSQPTAMQTMNKKIGEKTLKY